MSNNPIWPINRTLSGATSLGLSGHGSNSNEGVHHTHQSSSITGASPSDYSVSYPGHALWEEVLPLNIYASVYSIVPADWAVQEIVCDVMMKEFSVR